MSAIPLEEQISAIRAEFPATARMGYLNTGTIGPIPKQVLERHQDLERRYHLGGPLDRELSGEIRERFRAVRGKLATLLHTGPERIALAENTTAGINAALLSQAWSPGDEVITSDAEHPAVTVPLRHLHDRFGVLTRVVPVRGGVLWPDDVAAAVGPRSRAVVISHVSFSTGGAFPVKDICGVARERGLLTVIDGAQSVGAVDVAPDDIGCDFYAFPAYKWTLGPQGAGALYAAQSVCHLTPYRVASHAVARRDPDGAHVLYADARRYEGLSTLAMLDFITWGDAMDFLGSFGLEEVTARVAALSSWFKEAVEATSGLCLITPLSPALSAGLIVFHVRGQKADDAVNAVGARGLMVRTVPGDNVRASFHFYNTLEEVEALLGALTPLIA